MKTAPFKLRSGNKPSIAKLSGGSPAKQISQKVTEGFSKNIHNPGKTTRVTTIDKGTGRTSYVEKANSTGRTVREGSGNTVATKNYKASFKPKFDPMKTMKPGVEGFEKFQKTAKNISNPKTSNISKMKNVGKKILGKATKFLGGKALGIAGMMMGSIGTVDANPANKGKMTMKQEKDLVSRSRKMKKK